MLFITYLYAIIMMEQIYYYYTLLLQMQPTLDYVIQLEFSPFPLL